MPIFLHNTLSRQKEEFKPLDPAHVRMYVCGPTVYDFAHVGNARPVVVFDTLYRLLKRHYPKVTYVRNITDVDDKIMAKAKESGEPIDSITRRTTEAYHADMAALNALPPDLEPRATQHIGQMIAMIQVLVDKGHAYAAEGHVLFNVPSMKDYGQLSRRSRDELIAGARVDVAPYKKDPSDFVLWKPSAVDQPGWDSPWGRGRPGWHIECSAMAKEHLGVTFDIHGGGLDLIFPHHENEIAQSRCAHDGAPLAKVWMHNGFLTIDKDKMSKSLGNFFTVRELLGRYPGEAIRLTLLSAHYRQPLDFSVEALEQAKGALDRWYAALRNASSVQGNPEEKLSENFEKALSDDLNTPMAIKEIHALADSLNRAKMPLPAFNRIGKEAIKGQLLAAGEALGVLRHDPEAWFKWQPSGQSGPTDAEIEAQIAARLAARKAKNFAEADRIRDALAEQGVILEDGADGTTWRRA
ncbi:MAG: cysteine--tRNA ligase [Alphaproteobacteria bacterium]|nr:cysteine--tRNA ligase [Alphaproteobacteria bacterium]